MKISDSFLNLSSPQILKKYEKKFKFGFLKSETSGKSSILIITLTKKLKNYTFLGYDLSSYAIIITNQELETGKRYEIYGKIIKSRILVLICESIKKVDYKDLCYRIF